MRIRRSEACQADQSKKMLNLLAFFLFGTGQPKRDVFGHREPREKAWFLENQAAFQARTTDGFSIQFNRSRMGVVQSADDSQEGAFTATAAAYNTDKLSARDG